MMILGDKYLPWNWQHKKTFFVPIYTTRGLLKSVAACHYCSNSTYQADTQNAMLHLRQFNLLLTGSKNSHRKHHRIQGIREKKCVNVRTTSDAALVCPLQSSFSIFISNFLSLFIFLWIIRIRILIHFSSDQPNFFLFVSHRVN